MTITNAEVDWNTLPTKEYIDQYLDDVLPEDRLIQRFTIGALLELPISFESLEVGADICNGGTLHGPASIAPYVRKEIYWSDWGEPQCEQAQTIIDSGKAGDLGGWEPHQRHMGECHDAWRDAGLRACQLGKVVQQNLFELPENSFDIANMGYGAESLTRKRKEWEAGATSFFRSVRPGGVAIMLFMRRSTGYKYGDQSFPATSVDEADVLQVASRELTHIQGFYVPAFSQGVRPDDTQHSHEGLGAIVGMRK